MSPQILDGRQLAKAMGPGLRQRIAGLPRPPGLAVIRVGEDPASKVYVASKKKRATRLGFHSVSHELPVETSEADLLALVDTLNADDAIDGILVQLPLPRHMDEQRVLDAVAPDKDVDGFHPVNTGLLSQGRPRSIACTPYGCMKLLESAGVALSGAHAVVIGRSNIVGRPMAMLLEQANATVSLCHSRTKNLDALLATADVVVAAVGRPEMIRGEQLKPGCVVVDVGINRLDDGRLVGDVHFESASEKAVAITPVPGGVGPMTITMLMHNTVDAAERRLGLR